MGQQLTARLQAAAWGKIAEKAVFFFCIRIVLCPRNEKNGVKCRKNRKKVSVNVVQNEKMKISTIAESEKNSEKSLHCAGERVKILT